MNGWISNRSTESRPRRGETPFLGAIVDVGTARRSTRFSVTEAHFFSRRVFFSLLPFRTDRIEQSKSLRRYYIDCRDFSNPSDTRKPRVVGAAIYR